MKEKAKTIAKINDVSITLIDGEEKQVPIKPICQALGINHSNQMVKIQKDEILSSVVVLRTTTGNDGKTYEMSCIPFRFVFGWLFTINPKNVKTEARERIVKYRLECYEALFNHFTDEGLFLQQKQKALEKQLEIVENIQDDYTKTRKQLNDARRKLNDVKEMTFEEWKLNNRQLKIDFSI